MMLNSLETAGVQINNLDPESPQMYRRVATALQNLINAATTSQIHNTAGRPAKFSSKLK